MSEPGICPGLSWRVCSVCCALCGVLCDLPSLTLCQLGRSWSTTFVTSCHYTSLQCWGLSYQESKCIKFPKDCYNYLRYSSVQDKILSVRRREKSAYMYLYTTEHNMLKSTTKLWGWKIFANHETENLLSLSKLLPKISLFFLCVHYWCSCECVGTHMNHSFFPFITFEPQAQDRNW